jgi:hypothetical protein
MKSGPTGDAFNALARRLASQIAIRNANFAGTQKVEMKV